MTGKRAAAPRNLEQATALIAQFAEVDAQRAAVEEQRKSELGRINAAADAAVAPLLQELEGLQVRIETWWTGFAPSVLPKGRKSAQLGGCMIGTRKAAAKLAHAFDSDDKAVEALQGTRYAKVALKVRQALDRAATLRLLQVGGKTSQAIAELGFRVDEPGETFFLQRVEQDGSIGNANG